MQEGLNLGWKANTRQLLQAFVISGGVGALAMIPHCLAPGTLPAQAATAYLWAFACVSIGSLAGFLFGIPRTTDRDTVPVSALPQTSGNSTAHSADDPAKPNPAEHAAANPAAPDPAANPAAGSARPELAAAVTRPQSGVQSTAGPPKTHVNTNLEQVSDWLTKIIVGVGLTQLQHIPAAIQSVARTLSKALNPASGDPSLAFAEALVVYFTIIGFIYAYLLTRVYLQKVFDGPRSRLAGPHDEASHTNIVVAQ